MPPDKNPLAAGARPKLRSIPSASETPRVQPREESSVVTKPEGNLSGDPDWMVGRLLADKVYSDQQFSKFGAELTSIDARLKAIEGLMPTTRERRLLLVLLSILVAAIGKYIGVDLPAVTP